MTVSVKGFSTQFNTILPSINLEFYFPLLAKPLVKHFRSVSNVVNASVQDLKNVDGIGKVTAEKIRIVLDTEVL